MKIKKNSSCIDTTQIDLDLDLDTNIVNIKSVVKDNEGMDMGLVKGSTDKSCFDILETLL